MSEATDDGVRHHPDIASSPVDELTRSQLRFLIHKKLGFNQSYRTPLSKRALNAAHCYLTGEYVCQPGAIGSSDSPPTAVMREKAAGAADVGYDTNDRDSPRPYRRDELAALYAGMVASENQLPHQTDS